MDAQQEDQRAAQLNRDTNFERKKQKAKTSGKPGPAVSSKQISQKTGRGGFDVGTAMAGGIQAGGQIKAGDAKGAIKTLKTTGTKLATDYAKKVAWGAVFAPEILTTIGGMLYLNFHLLAALTGSDKFKMKMGEGLLVVFINFLVIVVIAIIVIFILYSACQIFGVAFEIGGFFNDNLAGLSEICQGFGSSSGADSGVRRAVEEGGSSLMESVDLGRLK